MKSSRILTVVVFSLASVFAASCGGDAEVATEAEASEAEAEVSEPAAESTERASPHESVAGTIGEANITVTYGRPYKKGREIFGGLVPLDKVWRTGADEATTLETDRDLMLGGEHVPAGKYSLYTIPSTEKWTLIVNKVSEQWGTRYDEAEDLVRVEMAVAEAAEMTEQLTIGIEAGEAPNGTLSIVWDKTVATLPIMAH